MTEDDWLASGYVYELLEHLGGGASPRKLRLFACGCCRLLWNRMTDPRSRAAVEASERFADGLASAEELASAAAAAPLGEPRGAQWNKVRLNRIAQIRRTAIAACRADAVEAAWEAARESMELLQADQCDLLREIFGDPFLPAAPPAGIAPDVAELAAAIYDERRFDRLPLLADALAAAGCVDADFLAHCRRPSGHVGGCWAVDRILGRE